MIRHEVLKAVEPKRRDTRQNLTLIGDLARQNVIKATDAIACHHQQRITTIVDVTYFALRVRTQLHIAHLEASFHRLCILVRHT